MMSGTKTELKLREWPLIIVSKMDVLHISRYNSGKGRVRTECGRDIGYNSTYGGKVEHLEKEKDGFVPGIVDWQEYKLCSRCGTLQDFISVQKEYESLHAEWRRQMALKEEFIREELIKEHEDFTDHVRWILRGVSGIDDITNDGMSLQFRMDLPDGGNILMGLAPVGQEGSDHTMDIRLRAAKKFDEMHKDKE